MRNAFADELRVLADADEDLVLLSGDIGNRLFDRFKDSHAERFLNCGVAEANMIGMAAGLALSGMRPVAYTITAFATVRCLEQIRVDLCYHDLPVTVVGVGAGLSYAALGYTHHAGEDIGFMRLLPNMSVLCPGDQWEARAALRAATTHDGPVYLRLGKKGEPEVHAEMPPFRIGGSHVVARGGDVCLLGVGTLLPMARDAAGILGNRGISAEVVSLYSVKPLDDDLLERAFADYPLVVVIEEHSRAGGAGGAVAEWLADRSGTGGRLLRIGLPDAIFHEAGSQDYARGQLGLTPQAITRRITAALEEARQ